MCAYLYFFSLPIPYLSLSHTLFLFLAHTHRFFESIYLSSTMVHILYNKSASPIQCMLYSVHCTPKFECEHISHCHVATPGPYMHQNFLKYAKFVNSFHFVFIYRIKGRKFRKMWNLFQFHRKFLHVSKHITSKF